MKVSSRILLGAVLIGGLLLCGSAVVTAERQAPQRRSRSKVAAFPAPAAFETNLGQATRQVRFLARTASGTLFLTAMEAVFAPRQPSPPFPESNRHAQALATAKRPIEVINSREPISVLRMRMNGADPNAAVDGVGRLAHRVNYLRGSTRNQWITDVPAYSSVRYRGVYPGIDLLYRGGTRAGV